MIGSAQPAVAARRLPFGLGRLADERLAQLVLAGRERAFAVLYERYHQPLYRYCRSMLRNDQDAQDALQSTFAAALAALQQGKRNAPFRPWLFRIAHNEAVTLIRRRRDTGHEISDSMLAPVASASEEADSRARMAMLMNDLGELPERQRAALVMRELNGLSHADIAVALATSVTAAKQAIFDARTALMEFAEGRALACEEVKRKISERDGRVLRSRRMRAHLRDCSSCAAFAAAIPERRADLRAIAPVLPAASSAALLARLGRSASTGGSGGGAGSAGTVGKLGATAFASKAAAGVTVVVTAAAGLGALPKVLPLVAPGDAPAVHAAPAHASHRGAAATGVQTVGRPAVTASGSSTSAAARAHASAVPGSSQHGSAASTRHANRGHRGAHSKTPPGLGAGSTSTGSASTPGRSGLPHGQSGLLHGQSGLSHGQSGLSHGKSAQTPGHTGTAGAGSAATHRSKPAHAAPGLTGTAGKSSSSTGHTGNASGAKSGQAALPNTPRRSATAAPAESATAAPAQSAPAPSGQSGAALLGQSASGASKPAQTHAN